MAKEPTELRPKAIRPIRRGNVEKQELYAEVGRAIVLLSDIESWLVAIAYHVALPTTGMKVPDMFYAIYGFEKRLKFADVIVDLEATDCEKKRWREITSELMDHKGIRNVVAHHGMGTSWPDKDGRVDVFLKPPDLKMQRHDLQGPRRPRLLSVKDIRATAFALSKISSDLEKLWDDIDESRYGD